MLLKFEWQTSEGISYISSESSSSSTWRNFLIHSVLLFSISSRRTGANFLSLSSDSTNSRRSSASSSSWDKSAFLVTLNIVASRISKPRNNWLRLWRITSSMEINWYSRSSGVGSSSHWGISVGILTRAKKISWLSGRLSFMPKFFERLLIKGKGWPGSTESGVKMGYKLLWK